MIKQSLFVLAALVALLLSFPLQASSREHSQNLQHVSLQLKFFHQFQFAGYYAAQAQGYYAEEGLDVEIKERQPGQDFIQQILDGKINFGIGDSGIIAHYLNGDALVALAAIFQHDALVFFSKQSSGIISPYEMAGKLIMYDAIGENNAPVRALLTEAGLNENRYILVAESFNIEDLIGDKVDVMSGYLTDKPFEFQQRKIKVNLINPQNYGIDFYGDLLFTSKTELIQHPGRAERFRRASIKGWQYALDHSEEIIQLIINQYHSKRSLSQLRFEAQETRKLVMPDSIPIGQIEVSRLRRVAEIYADLKLAPRVSDEKLAAFIFNTKPELNLTTAERNWLLAHPTIRVGIDRDFAPYEWIDQRGHYVGLVAEHLYLIESKLGVKFEIIKDRPWYQILDMAKHAELDMIAAAVNTPDRQQYLNFSPPYVSTPTVIIADNRLGYLGSLSLLAGRTVSVVKGYFIQELLDREYPKIKTIAVDSVQAALSLVAEGKVDAYIGDAASASFIIKQQGFTNLGFSGQSGYQSDTRFAVAKQHPELLTILQKTLDSIPQAQRDNMINRWMGLTVNPGISLDTLAKYVAVAILLLLLVGYWVFRLRREIKARRLSEAELALLYSNMSLGFALHEAIRNAKGQIIDSRYLAINPAFEKIIGIDTNTCVGKRSSRIPLPGLQGTIKHFAEIEHSKQPVSYEIYCQAVNRWLEADSYQAGPNQFVLLLQDISQRKQHELALKASEEKLRVSQNYADIVTWEFDLVNNRRTWSEIVNNGFGFPKTENPKWAHFLASVCKEDRPMVIDALRKHIKQGDKFDVEYRINVSGRQCWMRSIGQVERNEKGKSVRMLGVVQDISERKQAEEKLKLSARVFSDAHEGIMITDAKARILDVNAAFTQLTGYSHDEIIGQNPKFLKSDRQDADYYIKLWETLTLKGHWQGEIWNRHKSGEVNAQLLTISAVRDEKNQCSNYIGLFSDITESKMHQQKLEYLAHYDPLTGLPNRVLFADRFSQAIAHSKRTGNSLAICYLDLDGFKPVNDNFGHDVGDELLVQVATRIKLNLRECDTICRLGGDEFALLLQDLQSQPQCDETLRRIHQTLAEPFNLSDHPIWISASSGLTLYPQDNVDTDILLRHADQAMYQAKHAGRNCYRIYQDLISQGILNSDYDAKSENKRLAESKQVGQD